MSDDTKLINRINLLQKVSLGLVLVYFGAKYLLKVSESISSVFIFILLSVVLYRSFLQYKLTGDKTRVIFIAIAFCIAIGIGTYMYLNPQT
jgi:purine-cytosine permease-like protein